MAGEASSSVNESGKSVPLPDAVDYPTVTGDETQQEKANKYSGEEVNNEIATESLTTQHEYLSGIKLIGVASAYLSHIYVLEFHSNSKNGLTRTPKGCSLDPFYPYLRSQSSARP